MIAASRAWTGVLLCFAALQLSCTSLPPHQSADVDWNAKGDAKPQFPGLRCCDVSGLRFYFTGDAFLRRAEELIRGARDYILIDSFLTVDDEKGKRVFSLLRQRMDEGLRVYLITDSCSGFVSGFVDGRTAVPYLVESGIPVVEFNPGGMVVGTDAVKTEGGQPHGAQSRFRTGFRSISPVMSR